MKSLYHLHLPVELESIRSSVEKSLLPLNKILPFPKSTSMIDSKFSGSAYLPINYSYPKDVNGHTMALLAQINFSQIQKVEPFPKEGILQFFISPSIFQSNLAVEEQYFQHYFKIRYYPEILTTAGLNNTSQHLVHFDNQPFPIGEEMALSFTSEYEPVSAMDYRIDTFLEKPLAHYKEAPTNGRSVEDIYIEHFLGAEHKIGGYPYFIYEDTRKNSPFLRRFDTLLLQIVSNDAQKIMWGDTGLIKFFINKQKLMNLDFSDIYFLAEQYE